MALVPPDDRKVFPLPRPATTSSSHPATAALPASGIREAGLRQPVAKSAHPNAPAPKQCSSNKAPKQFHPAARSRDDRYSPSRNSSQVATAPAAARDDETGRRNFSAANP